ncbi:MAG TPA: pirin family protein, partial [Chitinophagaceae bacterium]|nr:pirin family protein [Chitinophagaceae bacterium]
EHEDSMGNKGVIKEGDVQVMSAGTGVMHSEYNKSKEEELAFLQIWLFPRAQNLSPRYDQVNINDLKVKNKFYQIISPNKDEQGAWINQDAWFYMGEFDAGLEEKYNLHNKENGVYFFILDGEVEIEGKKLSKRDALGIWNINNLNVKTLSKAQILLIEVPMNL